MLNRLKSIWSALDQARNNTVRDTVTLARVQDDVDKLDEELRGLVQAGNDMATLLKRYQGYGPVLKRWRDAVERVGK